MALGNLPKFPEFKFSHLYNERNKMFPRSVTIRISKVFWRAAAAPKGDSNDNGLEKFGCSRCRRLTHA